MPSTLPKRPDGSEWTFSGLLQAYDAQPDSRPIIDSLLRKYFPTEWAQTRAAREEKRAHREEKRILTEKAEKMARAQRDQEVWSAQVRKERWNVVNDIRYQHQYDRYRPGMPHDQLLARARNTPRKANAPNTVNAFSSWIYDVYPGRYRHPNPAAASDRLREGLAAEFEIDAARRLLAPHWEERGNWALVSSGLGSEQSPIYDIPNLLVDGHMLRGKPDYLFRHRHTGAALIVEIKASFVYPRRDAWPNARAQVWAYGQIRDIAAAREIILLVETWTPLGHDCTGRFLWRMGDAKFVEENRQLFDAYVQAPKGG